MVVWLRPGWWGGLAACSSLATPCTLPCSSSSSVPVPPPSPPSSPLPLSPLLPLPCSFGSSFCTTHLHTPLPVSSPHAFAQVGSSASHACDIGLLDEYLLLNLNVSLPMRPLLTSLNPSGIGHLLVCALILSCIGFCQGIGSILMTSFVYTSVSLTISWSPKSRYYYNFILFEAHGTWHIGSRCSVQDFLR